MEDKNYEEQPPTPIQQNSQHQLQYLFQQSSGSSGGSSGHNSMAENFDPGNCGTLYKVKSFELKREYYYEVNFKCSSKVYLSHKSYEIADMVIVSTTGGSNIGFISREVDLFELQCLNETFATTTPGSSNDPQSLFPPSLIPSKKILSKLKDGDETIHNLLLSKIMNERQALGKCHSILREHPSDSNIQILATEMQFDQKKLFVFLKRSDNSVCRLVRKFLEMFKIKIKIVEVESEEVIRDCAMKYLTLSKLPLSLMDLLPPVAAVAPPSLPQNSDSYSLNHAHGYGQATASTPPATLNIHSDPRHGHGHLMDSRSNAHHYQQQPQHSPSYSNHYQQGNATALPRNSHRYSSLYQHPNASLKSDLAHYGPPSLKYSSPPLGSQGVSGQSRSVGYGPPPQPKKPPHHGLLGPLMLISPSSVTSSGHPYFQRTPSSLGGEPFFPQEYHQNLQMPHHTVPPVTPPTFAPPPSPFFDPNWYGGFPPQSQRQSDSDYHFMTSQDQLFGQMNQQSSQHSTR
jgi:hypothetical protein